MYWISDLKAASILNCFINFKTKMERNVASTLNCPGTNQEAMESSDAVKWKEILFISKIY
jgi:hypothetical protein